MNNWKYLNDGGLRKNTKNSKCQARVWFTIIIPRIKYNEVKQVMGWEWSYPMVSIELVSRRLFKYWKTLRQSKK